MKIKGLTILLLALACPTTALALEVITVEVEKRDGRYFLRGESIIEAPRDFIRQIISDYENFHRLTSGVAETRFLPDPEGETPLGYTRIDACVLFFCRQAVKVERILVNNDSEVLTLVIPEQSDFEFNRTHWQFFDDPKGTLVIYEAEIEPDFWLPAVIGRWAIKRKLEASAEEIGARIEYLSDTGRPITDLNL